MKKKFYLLACLFTLGTSLNFIGCNSAPSPAAPVTLTAPVPTPTPFCASPSFQGLTAFASNSYSTGYLNTQAVTLASAETATGISVYVGSGPVTGQIRFGIYNNTAGGVFPGNLIIETLPQNLVASSWNSASFPNVYLPAGIYWLAFNESNNFNIYYNNLGGTNQYITNFGWAAFPVSYPTVPGAWDQYVLSFYLIICP